MPNKDTAYCDRIEARFPVAYSKAGVSHFGCPRIVTPIPYYIIGSELYCLAAQEEGCPVFARLEELIKAGNGKE